MEDIKAWLASNRPYSTGVALYLKHGTDALLRRLFQEGYSEFKYKKLQEALEKLRAASCELRADPVTNFPQSVTKTPDPVTKEPETENILREEVSILQDQVEDLANEKESLEDQVYDLESEVEDLRDQNQELQGKVKEIRKGWPAVMDDVLKPLHDEWLQLFSEKKNLQSRLYDVATAGVTDQAKKEEAGAMAHRILDLRDACRKIYQQRDHYLQHHKLPEEKPLMELSTNPNKWPTDIKNYERYVRDNKLKLKKNPNHPTAQKQIDKYQWAINELRRRVQNGN